VLTPSHADELVHAWDDGWNGEDVDTIMAPFAEDVVFSSPFVSRLTGDPDRTAIEGRVALRDYVEGALQRTPGIRYTIHTTYYGAGTLVLVYSCRLPDGRTKDGADSMRVDGDGRVVEWRCHYTLDSL
jgi:ketosteroid isomerase-like protein